MKEKLHYTEAEWEILHTPEELVSLHISSHWRHVEGNTLIPGSSLVICAAHAQSGAFCGVCTARKSSAKSDVGRTSRMTLLRISSSNQAHKTHTHYTSTGSDTNECKGACICFHIVKCWICICLHSSHNNLFMPKECGSEQHHHVNSSLGSLAQHRIQNTETTHMQSSSKEHKEGHLAGQ